MKEQISLGGNEIDWEVKYYPECWGGKKLAYPDVAPEAPKFSRSVVVGNLILERLWRKQVVL